MHYNSCTCTARCMMIIQSCPCSSSLASGSELMVMLRWTTDAEGLKNKGREGGAAIWHATVDDTRHVALGGGNNNNSICDPSVRSGLACLQREQPAGRRAHDARWGAATVCASTKRRTLPFILSPSALRSWWARHARRHLVSATVPYLWGNEADHMPVSFLLLLDRKAGWNALLSAWLRLSSAAYLYVYIYI